MTEPDFRPPPSSDTEPDWDTLDASYEAPGARDVVPRPAADSGRDGHASGQGQLGLVSPR